MRQVLLVTEAGMVGVGVRDDGALHGLPGIYINIGLTGINSFICELNQHPLEFTIKLENFMPEVEEAKCGQRQEVTKSEKRGTAN
jgi:hypothetical protein